MGATQQPSRPGASGPSASGATASGGPSGPSTSARAVQAVTLLAGFYLLAFGIIAAVLGADILATLGVGHASPFLAKLYVFSLAIAYPVLRVVFLSRRPRGGDLAGLPVTPEQQPELWARVNRLAELTGVRGPSEIKLVAEVNAGVREDTGLLGLIPGKRHLYIGVPLLLGLTEAELDSVLAHELGHYGNQDVRLAGVTVAGRSALVHTIGTLHERADARHVEHAAKLEAKAAERLAKGKQPSSEQASGGGVDRALAGVFTAYAKLYFKVSESVSRRQELAADLTAARIAGRDATASALRRIPLLDAAQSYYLNRYATIGWDAGLLPLPGEVYGGLARLLADPRRRAELEEMGLELPGSEPDPYDSHPPIAQRVAAIEALPDDGRGSGPDGPAIAVLRDAGRVLADIELVTLIPEAATKRRVDWPELIDRTCRADHLEGARPMLAALTASGLPGTVHALLDAIDAGRTGELADRLPKSAKAQAATGRAAREFLRPAVRAGLSRLTVLALADAGLAHWELSWAVAAELHLPEGVEDALGPALDAATADAPDTTPLRALLASVPPGAPTPLAD